MESTTRTLAVCAVLLVVPSLGLHMEELYSYGDEVGDNRLPVGDDESSYSVRLQFPITFYGQQYSSLYVNTNGLVSLDSDIPTFQSHLVLPIQQKVIAPFLADVDTELSGNIYYRETRDPSLVDVASNIISEEFPHRGRFQASALFIVTWDDVGYYQAQYDLTNTFQLVLASDNSETYAFFLYPTSGITWVRGLGGKESATSEDIPAQVGFDGGYGGQHYIVPGSGTEDIYNLGRWSNTRSSTPGVWLFRIGRLDQNVETPDQPQQIGGETPSHTPTTCDDGGSRTCSQSATCEDGYRGGYCCVCMEGYYGNGLRCLKSSDQAQRVSGSFSGTINGVRLDANVHVYVQTVEGKAYTAIDQLPAEIGPSLKSLYALGGVWGWLFAATTTPSAMNGYMLTGGEFNRSVTVNYQSGESVTIRETFTSHDDVEWMKVDVTVDGNVPFIAEDSEVIGDDTSEDYNRIGNGHLRSYATHTFSVDGVRNSFTAEQTIDYKKCSGSTTESMETMRLSRSRMMLIYGDNIIRYVETASIAEADAVAIDDPCLEGSRTCDVNAICVVIGVGYQCECRAGYRGDGQRCLDVDECSLGYSACHESANCINSEGSYQCECMQGYHGDGQYCERDSRCGHLVCDVNALCVYDEYSGIPDCQCQSSYTGDGTTCYRASEFSCNEVDNCDVNADCNYDQYSNSYVCECADGFSGDGFSCTDSGAGELNCRDCDANADCLYDVNRLTYRCTCNAGYSGDGYRCYPMAETCDVAYNCDVNAQCRYDEYSQGYVCICNPGYRGDGYRCDSDVVEEDCSQYNICDVNAQCEYNEREGRYQCVCVQGYQGDGRYCDAASEPCNSNPEVCDYNADCVFDVGTYQYVCQCREGYNGDGFQCQHGGEQPPPSNTCDVANNCHPDAECTYDHNQQGYHCVCRPEFTGDGYRCEREQPSGTCDVAQNCHPDAECTYDHNQQGYHCVCRPEFTGDGYRCEREQPSGTCDVAQNCHPDAECTYDHYQQGYHCVCRPEFTGDGYRCEREQPPADCRYDPSSCDYNAECAAASEGVYTCQCNQGYYGDGFMCTAVIQEQASYLIYAQGLSVMKIPFNPTEEDPGEQLIYDEGQTAVGVDVDCGEGFVYWSDVTGRTISKARLNGSDQEVVIRGLGSPEGVAIDWIGRNIYWTDSESDSIEVANLDGLNHKVLVEDVKNPRAIVMDPVAGILFWSDWTRSDPKIETSNMDGSERRVLVSEDLGLPNGLTMDFEYQQLCWADAGTQHIECVNYDGRGRRVVYDLASYPFGLAYANRMFYWTDWTMDSLSSITRYGGTPNDPMELPAGGNGNLFGITTVNERCPAGSNACSLNNGGCQYLCLPTPNRGRVCACPDDVTEEECQQGVE